jgi:hypothetical protein
MYKVHLETSQGHNQLLGHVLDDGKVYRTKVGLDDYVGRVELATGKIYEERFGPDKKVGHVDLENGKVYLTRLGPDQYVGKVDGHGRMHRHVSLTNEELVGKIDQFVSYGHSAAAMLLLVMPALEAKLEGEKQEREENANDGK